jgi:hypothetical protein
LTPSASKAPPTTPHTDDMPTEDERHHDHTPSPAHIPLGQREVPLLEHDHVPLKFARQHHAALPHHDQPGFAHYQAAQRVALSNAVKSLEDELAARGFVQHIELQNETLILHPHSQSKLSQQELADLQKATHFDKKELQQWYKGARHMPSPYGAILMRFRIPKGLPVRHAYQGGVSKDI